MVLELLSRLLKDEGHQMDTVDNAADALEMIKDSRYSLIVPKRKRELNRILVEGTPKKYSAGL